MFNEFKIILMKNFISISCLLFVFGSAFAQLKVNTNGNITVGSNAATATPLGVFNVRLATSSNPTALFGGFNIQALGDINGFLGQNGYWNSATQRWTYLGNGVSSLLQLVNGNFLIRTAPAGTAGGRVGGASLGTPFKVDFNGTVSIGHGSAAFPAGANKLLVNGNIVATGTVTPSDSRLKRSVEKSSLGLKELMRINTVTFKYNKASGLRTDELHVGVIAQDIKKVIPMLVSETTISRPVGPTSLDQEQTYGPAETFLSVKDSELKYLMINAIKEQQAMITEQAKLIEKLEAKVNAMTPVIKKDIPSGSNN